MYYPKNREQEQWLLAGCEAVTAALKDAKDQRIVTLPDWTKYAPEWAIYDDLPSRFWQRGFVVNWNHFAEQLGWPKFPLRYPMDGHQEKTAG